MQLADTDKRTSYPPTKPVEPKPGSVDPRKPKGKSMAEDLRQGRKEAYLNPDAAYKDQWRGWDDFLCIGEPKAKNKSPEEWVPIAEDMARENGGKLQHVTWLEKNGHSGIVGAMRRRPRLFKHIEQDRKQRTPEEWVPIAEELARSNGGKLQNSMWLEKNKYIGLVRAMRRYPDLFARIEQERMCKTPEEWVPAAEELARKNGGKLQNVSWLRKNNYRGLATAMQKHPGLFARIEQERRHTNGQLVES